MLFRHYGLLLLLLLAAICCLLLALGLGVLLVFLLIVCRIVNISCDSMIETQKGSMHGSIARLSIGLRAGWEGEQTYVQSISAII